MNFKIMIRLNYLIICLILSSCQNTNRSGMADHPRKIKVRTDSDVVYVLKIEYPEVYNDIIVDGLGCYTGKITSIVDDNSVGIEFPRGVMINDLFSHEIIIYRDKKFISKAKFKQVYLKNLVFELYDKSNEIVVMVNDKCSMKL